MKKYLSELIGTFILVFVGTGVVIVNQQTNGAISLSGIAACWGFVIIALVYAFGDISGAHFNPAVTLAFAADKRLPVKDILPYLAVQFSGALGGSICNRLLFPDNLLLGAVVPSGSAGQSFLIEVLMMFVLMMVILRVSTGAKEKGITAGIAVGGTVWALVLFGGPVSGTALNPARALAPAMVVGHLEYIWIYLLAPVAGAFTAVGVNRFLYRPDER